MRRFLILLAACTAPTSSSSQPIIGGALAPNDTSTVLLVSYPQDKSVQDNCSAVIVSDTTLLTAAHCIDATNHPGYSYGVFLDADASVYPKLVDILPHLLAVKAVHAHPSYDGDTADIGVVELMAPTSVSPMPIQFTALPAQLTNLPARIVGYGQTVYGTYNQVRYGADTTVVGLGDTDSVVVGDDAKHGCLGDSGGPAILNGHVIGVDSHGPVGCTGASYYRRTDAYASFLSQYVTPPPSPGTDAGVVSSGPEAGTDNPATGNGGGGGCSTSSGAGPLVLLALLLRRKRVRLN